MNLIKKSLYIIAGIFITGTVLLYLLFLFILPKCLNSSKAVVLYENVILRKTGVAAKFQNFNFYSKPDMSFIVTIDAISAQTPDNLPVVKIDKINYTSKRFSLYPTNLDINEIYADISLLRPLLKTRKKTSSSNFKIDNYPVLNVKKAFIKLDDKSNAVFNNISSFKSGKKIITGFNSKVVIPYLKMPLYIGDEGKIIYDNGLVFENLSVKNNNSKLYISGKTDNLNFKGGNLPAGELKDGFLYFYKLKYPNKKNFIENFYNLSGKIDVDLNLSSKGIRGICKAKNLSALFMQYKIPIFLPDTDFKFTGREITAKTEGTLGNEPVTTDLFVRGIATKNLTVSGNVYSNITNRLTKNYFPIVNIIGSAGVHVKYHTQNGISDVIYTVNLPKNSDLLSKFGNAGNTDKIRIIYAHTKKIGDKIKIENYKYSFLDGKNSKPLLTGGGLFEKNNGHYIPSVLSLKTNGNLPVYIIQPLIEDYLVGGTFSADLKYEFKNKILSGYVNLFNVSHEDYLFLKTARLNISDNTVKLNSEGSFINSPLTVSIIADNNFRNNINVRNIDIHLKKFQVKRGNMTVMPKEKKIRKTEVQPKRKYNVTVQKGKIYVDEIVHSKFYLHDVEIDAKLKNRIVDFIIPETDYSKGILSAKGSYNLANHSSDIYFYASDIDSNEVASKIFNLYNQIEGSGFATLHLKTKNKLNNIHAHATFAISDGYLPKLGSREFIIGKSSKNKFSNKLKKTWKFSLEKITNIDFSKKEILTSNLRGSFIIDNSKVHNVKIFSQSDYLSMFIEGAYDISTQHSDLYIWGRHNKTKEKKIRIFKIPLTLIYRVLFKIEHTKELYKDKIAMIPLIKIQPTDIESLFRVFICGNLNSDNLKVILKDLR